MDRYKSDSQNIAVCFSRLLIFYHSQLAYSIVVCMWPKVPRNQMFVPFLIKPRRLNSALFMQRLLQSRFTETQSLTQKQGKRRGGEGEREDRSGRAERGEERTCTAYANIDHESKHSWCRRTSRLFTFTPLVYIPEIQGAYILICFQQTFFFCRY